MTDKVECVVIGAGVVGLAVAAQLAAAGREVIVLEQHSAIGTETSSRNSKSFMRGFIIPVAAARPSFVCAARRCCINTVIPMRCPISGVASHCGYQ